MTPRRQLIRGLASLATASILPACATMPPAAQGSQPISFTVANGIGCILLDAPIVPQTRAYLRADMDGLVKAGATTIRLGINSPGGQIEAAQAIVQDMNQIRAANGVTFETYTVGLVASAATYVFMNGQRRFARNGTGFLFHAAGLVSNGPVSAERLREEASKIDAYEQAVRALLKARTKLTDPAIDVYLHRTVILSADDARRDGVVEAIAPFTVPTGAKLISITARRVPAPSGAAPAQNGTPVNGR